MKTLNRLFLIMWFLALSLAAQNRAAVPLPVENAAKPETMLFRGSINNRLFEMTLARDGENLSGSYFYVKSGQAKSRKMRGQIEAQSGKVILREYSAANRPAGEFQGVISENPDDYDLDFEGRWISGPRQKQLDFTAAGQIIGLTGGRRIETRYIHQKDVRRLSETEASYPQITGGNATDVREFNRIAGQLIIKPLAKFNRMIWRQTAEDRKHLRADGNSLAIFSYVKLANDNLVSVQYFYSESSNGMIHPLNSIKTLNYDLKNKRRLTLAELFRPGAKYLEIIAAYCLKKLQGREPVNGQKLADGDWADGVSPKAENYENWNLMKRGILITFADYQIASYPAGMQSVLIPYSELKNIAQPGGILATMVE